MAFTDIIWFCLATFFFVVLWIEGRQNR